MCFLSKSIWPYGPLTPLNLIPLHQNKLVNTSLNYKMTSIGKQCNIIFGQNFEIQITVDRESAVAQCTPVVSAD